MVSGKGSVNNIIREAVVPFSLEGKNFDFYLEKLNGLPAYDIILNFCEAILLFEQEKKELKLSEEQICQFESFRKQIMELPPEPDSFWRSPHHDLRWSKITSRARGLLAALSR